MNMLTNFTPLVGTELFEDKGLLMAVITSAGIIIVFVILLLLIFIFYAYGAIFRVMNASKEKKAAKKKAAEEAAKASERQSSPIEAISVGASTAAAEDGSVPGEIIAVIAAAVASLGDGRQYAIKKVSRAQRQTGKRSAWAASGVYENTRPF